MTDAPLILWFRRDLRLADHPMLARAAETGRPLIPVAILDPETEALGAAAKLRLGLGLEVFAQALKRIGLRLTFRRGEALSVLESMGRETGATGVHWSRLYDPPSVARDTGVKAGLKAAGLEAVSHEGHLLHEPWTVTTGTGGFYRVYTPFWRAVKDRPVADATPAPTTARSPDDWPTSETLESWALGAAMRRGGPIVAAHQRVGADLAEARMTAFLDQRAADYRTRRDLPGEEGTSGLSQNLSLGEIGPRMLWHAATRALHEGKAGAETYLRELAWREFAYHLMHHTPHIVDQHWRPEWNSFPWRADNDDAERWRRGMTGVPFVDAAMREMYVTGTIHNRARMIAASYLTKHLLTDWRVGSAWFADCLTDWDPASNAMGWQWAAGSGPDSAPFFRIFNPETQAEKFDPDMAYRTRFVAELSDDSAPEARAYFDAVPRAWQLDPAAPYPTAVITLAEGRTRALTAYGARAPGSGNLSGDVA